MALAYRAKVLSLVGIESRESLEEAIRIGRRVLESQRRILGPNHPETLATLCQLGESYLQHGDYREASDLLGLSLAGRVRLLGPDHADSIAATHALGRARHALGDLETAEGLLARAMEGRRRAFGPRYPATLSALNDLANVMRDRGRTAEAVPLFREVVAGLREYHGTPYFPGARQFRGYFVDALHDQGDTVAIRDLCDGWLREFLEMPPEADPRVLGLKMVQQSCLAFWLAAMSEELPFDAELAVRAARQAAEQGDDLRDNNWTRLGVVYLRLGDLERAEEAVKTSMERRKGGDRFDGWSRRSSTPAVVSRTRRGLGSTGRKGGATAATTRGPGMRWFAKWWRRRSGSPPETARNAAAVRRRFATLTRGSPTCRTPSIAMASPRRKPLLSASTLPAHFRSPSAIPRPTAPPRPARITRPWSTGPSFSLLGKRPRPF
ncbi:MAG: tetratricopeptide repeat protein [Isosphaerales bacterium]